MDPRFIATAKKQRRGGSTPAGPPEITSITPDQGAFHGNESVVIAGTGFSVGFEGGDASVKFGADPAENIVIDSDIQISCTVPTLPADDYDVIVETDLGSDTLVAGFTINP